MKFLFDENIGWTVVSFFKKQGYDIKSVLEELRGSEDKDLLKIAFAEKYYLYFRKCFRKYYQ